MVTCLSGSGKLFDWSSAKITTLLNQIQWFQLSDIKELFDGGSKDYRQ